VRARTLGAWPGAVLLAALPVAGADLTSLERGLRDAIAERDRLTLERARRISEAGGVADDIARVKAADAAPRADPDLEAALKRFDRIAADLDELDRTIRDRDRHVATLRRRFDAEATVEAARLSSAHSGGRIGDVARQVAAIDEARRRVSRLSAGEPAIRPALVIRLSPSDGPLQVEQKLALAEAERDRLAGERARLDTAAAVVAARLLAKQQLAADLEGAARAGGSELAILTRESQNTAQAVQDLRREQEEVGRQKARLAESLASLDRHLDEFRQRLIALQGVGERP
jgi:chromosome segregation ATPase